jgi:hypothetical protein
MNGFRSFSKGIAVFLLFITLLTVPLVMALQAAVNSPDVVKNLLDKSNTYETLRGQDLLLSNEHLSSAARSDPGVIAAFNDSISPAYVKASSEKLIDNTYSYIRGNTAALELSIDIKDAKTQFANNIASYVKRKFEALPRCSELKIPSTSIESLLGATCAPISISSQQASQYARNEIMNTTLFSNDRLELEGLIGVRESLLSAYINNVRSVYPYFISLVYILPLASIILAVTILFLSNTRRRGVKIIANILMSVGLINVLGSLVVIGLAGIILGDGSQAVSTVTSSLERTISNLLDYLRMWWLGVAGLFVVISIVAYIALAVTQKSHSGSMMSLK